MKRLIALMAKYSAQVNRQLFDILGSMPAEKLSAPAGSYFDSILGLLNHILVSDLGWLSAYRGSDISFASLQTEVLDFEHPGWGKPLYEDFGPLRERRFQVDQVLEAFAAEATEEQLAGPITLTDWRGNKNRMVFGEVLLHLFNHHTHHRGQISQILDREGVENDYSNLVRYVTRLDGDQG